MSKNIEKRWRFLVSDLNKRSNGHYPFPFSSGFKAQNRLCLAIVDLCERILNRRPDND